MKDRQLGNILTILVVMLCLFLCFSKLTSLELRLWDEARNAVNALEMAQNGFSFVTTYDWKPDHWNTKPPFLIWIQALFYKILGLTVFATRLPSILAALAFIPIFISLAKKWDLGRKFSLTTIIVLFTIPLFLFVHTFRTGDYDGLLALMMFSYSLFYVTFLEFERKRNLWLFFLFLLLAVMTKGIAGLLFLPGLFMLTLLWRKLRIVLTDKDVFLGAVLLSITIGGYYFLRNLSDPNYWSSVVQNELGGRFLDSADNHSQASNFYFHYLRDTGLRWYYYLLPLFSIVALLGQKTRKYAIFCIAMITTHHGIMWASQTKLYWYILPEIPFVAMLFGLGYTAIYRYLQQLTNRWNVIHLGCFLLLAYPIFDKIQTTSRTTNLTYEQKDYSICQFLIANMEKPEKLDKMKILIYGNYTHARFYVEQYEQKGGVIYLSKMSKIAKGDRVLISDENLTGELKGKFALELIEKEFGASVFRVLDFK